MRNKTTRQGWIIASVMLAACAVRANELDLIVSGFKAREHETVMLRWKTRRFISAKACEQFNVDTASEPLKLVDSEATIPKVELYLRGKTDLRYNREPYNSRLQIRSAYLSHSATNQDVRSTLRSGLREYGEGYLGPPNPEFEWQDEGLRVPLLLFRPISSGICDVENGGWQLSGRESINGALCTVLVRVRSKTRQIVHLDTTHSYRPVKFEEFIGDFKVYVWNIQYGHDDEQPDAWSFTRYDQDAGVLWSSRATALDIDVDLHLPDDLFVVEFPVGTRVRDERSNEIYILTEGGGKKRVSTWGSDIGKPSRDENKLDQRFSFFYFNIAVFAVLVAILVWKRRDLNKQS